MRKVLIVITVVLPLAACQTFNNPFASNSTLASVESTYGAALALAVTYKSSCTKHLIPDSCKGVVAQLKAADAKAYQLILTARAVSKQGDQLSIIGAVAAAEQAVNIFYGQAQGAK